MKRWRYKARSQRVNTPIGAVQETVEDATIPIGLPTPLGSTLSYSFATAAPVQTRVNISIEGFFDLALILCAQAERLRNLFLSHRMQ